MKDWRAGQKPDRSPTRHFVFVSLAGFMTHGYPAIRPSDGQLQEWIDVTDLNRFTIGVYIEALGYLFLLPFAAWLYSTLRSATGCRPWTTVLALAAGAGYVVLVLPINESWVGILEQGKQVHFRMSAMSVVLSLAAADLALGRAFITPWARRCKAEDRGSPDDGEGDAGAPGGGLAQPDHWLRRGGA